MATRADRDTRRSSLLRSALPALLALMLALVAGAQLARPATDSVVRGPSAAATTMLPSVSSTMDSAASAAIDPEAVAPGSDSPALPATGPERVLRNRLVGSARTSRAPPAAL
jgi:uncharacterized protein YabE (DUF348 family)